MEVQIERSQSFAITKLYHATFEGDVQSLIKLLEEDRLILKRCINQRSKHLMKSPLHVAAEMGHLEIVKTLLVASPNMCFVRDQDGMTPIHVAVVHNNIDVLEMLYNANPHVVRERTNGGEFVLHLCIKHNKEDSLKVLLSLIDDELLNSKDSDGNTALHLAVIGNQSKMVKMLLERPKIEVNAMNKNEMTALDLRIFLKLENNFKDVSNFLVEWPNDEQIGPSLELANALQARHELKIKNRINWVENQSNALMVVASLIATMAFSVATNPPGGFWQDTQNGHHKAGHSIEDDYDQFWFNNLVIWNTIALVSSLSVILLLISGLPYGRVFVGILRITMWIAVTATTATYGKSLFLTIYSEAPTANTTLFWVGVLVLMLLGHAILFAVKCINRRPKLRARILKLFKLWFA
ncbi:ankyrin repeat-containing protein NPR4-like [Chenopodium quinoa]|nr:ankyrin repeat-containing protein NPR4-like [Chenopodium quinoa]XP_021739135.1 ankyrin repeat-containing protein NPR4-like [Chenopodium quinoa]